jgi:hypothetical protein
MTADEARLSLCGLADGDVVIGQYVMGWPALPYDDRERLEDQAGPYSCLYNGQWFRTERIWLASFQVHVTLFRPWRPAFEPCDSVELRERLRMLGWRYQVGEHHDGPDARRFACTLTRNDVRIMRRNATPEAALVDVARTIVWFGLHQPECSRSAGEEPGLSE